MEIISQLALLMNYIMYVHPVQVFTLDMPHPKELHFFFCLWSKTCVRYGNCNICIIESAGFGNFFDCRNPLLENFVSVILKRKHHFLIRSCVRKSITFLFIVNLQITLSTNFRPISALVMLTSDCTISMMQDIQIGINIRKIRKKRRLGQTDLVRLLQIEGCDMTYDVLIDGIEEETQ